MAPPSAPIDERSPAGVASGIAPGVSEPKRRVLPSANVTRIDQRFNVPTSLAPPSTMRSVQVPATDWPSKAESGDIGRNSPSKGAPDSVIEVAASSLKRVDVKLSPSRPRLSKSLTSVPLGLTRKPSRSPTKGCVMSSSTSTSAIVGVLVSL